jgi:prevent-host-death family protein
METVTYSDARGNFRKTMDRICEDHISVVVTRQNKPAVVMMSLEDYNGIEKRRAIAQVGTQCRARALQTARVG